MIQKVSIKNFRTHTDTSLELGAVTLIIGPNNAGKTNLFEGINYFSRLIARARPENRLDSKILRPADFFPHRHRLASSDVPISFACVWTHKLGQVNYQIELYESIKLKNKVGCREKIELLLNDATTNPKILKDGWDKPLDIVGLQTKLASERLQTAEEKSLTVQFFQDLATCFYYDLQPVFLKRDIENSNISFTKLNIASELGKEGENLQQLLRYIQEKEQPVFDRFLRYMRRFEPSFHSLFYDSKKGQMLWQFTLGYNTGGLESFPTDMVSGGLLKAAAVALLASMKNPPALILMEEIENGISQENLKGFLTWLRQATSMPDSTDRGHRTQFIVTSHSPSVLREFARSNLNDIYYVRIKREGGHSYNSVVTSLNSSLSVYVDMGILDGKYEELDGKRIVNISSETLLGLWYTGSIGGGLLG